jgi:hypothetical protein
VVRRVHYYHPVYVWRVYVRPVYIHYGYAYPRPYYGYWGWRHRRWAREHEWRHYG